MGYYLSLLSTLHKQCFLASTLMSLIKDLSLMTTQDIFQLTKQLDDYQNVSFINNTRVCNTKAELDEREQQCQAWVDQSIFLHLLSVSLFRMQIFCVHRKELVPVLHLYTSWKIMNSFRLLLLFSLPKGFFAIVATRRLTHTDQVGACSIFIEITYFLNPITLMPEKKVV